MGILTSCELAQNDVRNELQRVEEERDKLKRLFKSLIDGHYNHYGDIRDHTGLPEDKCEELLSDIRALQNEYFCNGRT